MIKTNNTNEPCVKESERIELDKRQSKQSICTQQKEAERLIKLMIASHRPG